MKTLNDFREFCEYLNMALDSVQIACGLLKKKREERGLSQRELARMAKTTPESICRIERLSRVPSLGLYLRVLNALGEMGDGWINEIESEHEKDQDE